MTEAIIIRNYTAGDYSFILNSWLMSYKAGSTFAEHIPHAVYFAYHHSLIDNILSRKTTNICIAVAEDDPDMIYGYAIFEEINHHKLFHYIYIKKSFHGFNIKELLIESAPFEVKKGVFCSHLTEKGFKLLEKYNLEYNPYLV
jgi:hypothetical protein